MPQERKTKRISVVFIALELHPCLMLKDHAAFKKGVWRSLLQSRDQQCGEEALEIKRKTSGCQEGCAPGWKGLGKPCRWSAGTGGLRAIVPSLRGCKTAPQEVFFSKNEPHSLQNPPPSANSIPAGTWPPAASALTTPSPPIPGKIPSQHRNYRLSWEKKHMRHSDYIEMLLPVSVTLKKWVSPKKWDLWPCSYQECSLVGGAQL